MTRLLLAFLALSTCRRPATPVALADFIGSPGKLEATCVAANDGQRLRVDGKVVVEHAVEQAGDDVTLEWGDDAGQASFRVLARSPRDVTLETGAMKADWRVGYQGKSGALKGITLHTTAGDAHPGDPLRLTVEVEVIKHFQTKAVTACQYRVVSFDPR